MPKPKFSRTTEFDKKNDCLIDLINCTASFLLEYPTHQNAKDNAFNILKTLIHLPDKTKNFDKDRLIAFAIGLIIYQAPYLLNKPEFQALHNYCKTRTNSAKLDYAYWLNQYFKKYYDSSLKHKDLVLTLGSNIKKSAFDGIKDYNKRLSHDNFSYYRVIDFEIDPENPQSILEDLKKLADFADHHATFNNNPNEAMLIMTNLHRLAFNNIPDNILHQFAEFLLERLTVQTVKINHKLISNQLATQREFAILALTLMYPSLERNYELQCRIIASLFEELDVSYTKDLKDPNSNIKSPKTSAEYALEGLYSLHCSDNSNLECVNFQSLLAMYPPKLSRENHSVYYYLLYVLANFAVSEYSKEYLLEFTSNEDENLATNWLFQELVTMLSECKEVSCEPEVLKAKLGIYSYALPFTNLYQMGRNESAVQTIEDDIEQLGVIVLPGCSLV